MDSRLQRRVQRYGWDRAVEHYEEHWLARLAPATGRVLELAELRPGERVLDVAGGTGVLAIAAAAKVGRSGLVIGTDISEKMVEAARAAAAALNLSNCRFERGDAETLPDFGTRFDVGLCGLGLMYMPEPERALATLAGALVPGGRVVVSVWGPRKHCGWADIFPIVDARVQSEVCPMFFRLGAAGQLARALEAAGLAQVRTESLSVTLDYESADEAADAAFLGGPVALAYAHFDAATRAAVREEYRRSIAGFRCGSGYAVPGEFVIGYGVNPAGDRHSCSDLDILTNHAPLIEGAIK